MLIIRRRTSSGQLRRIPLGGINFTVDTICPGEALTTKRSDAISLLEAPTTVRFDVSPVAEAQARFSADIISQFEALGSIQANLNAILESGGSLQIIADRFAAIEYQANFQQGTPVISEYTSLVSAQTATANYNIENLVALHPPTINIPNEYLVMTGRFNEPLNMEYTGLTTILVDAAPQIESLSVMLTDRAGDVETIARVLQDLSAPQEYTSITATPISSDTLVCLEVLSIGRGDTNVVGEILIRLQADAQAKIEQETITTTIGTAVANLETLTSRLVDASIRNETLGIVSVLALTTAEYLNTVRSDIPAPIAVVGQIIVTGDVGAQLEFRASQISNATIADETLGSVHAESISALSMLNTTIATSRSALEFAAALISDFGVGIEALSLRAVEQVDVAANIEVAGTATAFPGLLLAVIEYGQVALGDTFTPQENQAIVTYPFDPDATIPIDGPYLVLDKTHTSMSLGRVRLVVAAFTAPEVHAQPFDPMAAGTIDTFGFDLTADAGGATIASATWRVTFDPGLTEAADDVAGARAITSWAPTTIYFVNPLNDQPQAINGTFVVAVIGTFPDAAVGGTYHLEADVTLSDTRSFKISSMVLCVEST